MLSTQKSHTFAERVADEREMNWQQIEQMIDHSINNHIALVTATIAEERTRRTTPMLCNVLRFLSIWVCAETICIMGLWFPIAILWFIDTVGIGAYIALCSLVMAISLYHVSKR
jgi:hypothetical protein